MDLYGYYKKKVEDLPDYHLMVYLKIRQNPLNIYTKVKLYVVSLAKANK